jgi:ubiquinone/menaquinone biosynthesis C-methylase UbiE
MILAEKIYYAFHRAVSHPEERGTNSAGPWQRLIRNYVLELCRGLSGSLLEIGCGEGIFLIQLSRINPGLKLVGIDNDSEMIRLGDRRIKESGLKNISLVWQQADQIVFQDSSFDTIVCINVLLNMDLELVKRTLVQMSRLCKPGGRIIFEFRNRLNPFLVLKYLLAPYYDKTIIGKKLSTFFPRDIFAALRQEDFTVTTQIRHGFFIKDLAPLIIIEARKQ